VPNKQHFWVRYRINLPTRRICFNFVTQSISGIAVDRDRHHSSVCKELQNTLQQAASNKYHLNTDFLFSPTCHNQLHVSNPTSTISPKASSGHHHTVDVERWFAVYHAVVRRRLWPRTGDHSKAAAGSA
jgi:hypothetical protein